MSTETTMPVDPPTGAVVLDDWCDVGCPEGAWRSISGQRRGIARYYVGDSSVGPHFVEAHGIQEADGRVTEGCVRAEIDAWNLNRHEDWATALSPAEARGKAAGIRATIAELSVLAEALDTAAGEVECWQK